jgi:AcrR family transcriptional regulator
MATPAHSRLGHVVEPALPTGPLPRAARQEAILRGAARAFAGTGYAATSMEDIAAASGITKLIVYRHFDSKEELYRSVLQRVFDRLAEEFVIGYSRGAGGVGARSLLTVAREDPDGFQLLWHHASSRRCSTGSSTATRTGTRSSSAWRRPGPERASGPGRRTDLPDLGRVSGPGPKPGTPCRWGPARPTSACHWLA